MKQFLLLIAICLSVAIANAAEYVIGTGSQTQSSLPVSGANDFGWSKMIITKAELNATGFNEPGEIAGMGLQVDNLPAYYTFEEQHIFIRHFSNTYYSSANTTLPDSGMFVQVFSGNLRFHGSGWLQIAFQTPFEWNNEQSLEILWKNYDGSSQGNHPTFRYTPTTEYRCAYVNASGSFPAGNGARTYNRPNLQLITPMLPLPVQAVYPLDASVAVLSSTLAWRGAGGCPATYDLYLDTVNPPQLLVAEDLAESYYQIEFMPQTTYYWKVVPANIAGSPAACPIWTFTTPRNSQLAESFETATFPPPGWSNPDNLPLTELYPYQGSKCLAVSASAAGKTIVTPRLGIQSGSILWFQARKHNLADNSFIRVKYSADGTAWSVFGSPFALAPNVEWATYGIDLGALAGGSWLLGIEVFNGSPSGFVYVSLDHIVGPEPAGELAAPELVIVQESGIMTLSWAAVPNASGYRVYTSADPHNWCEPPLAEFDAQTLSYNTTAENLRFFRLRAFSE